MGTYWGQVKVTYDAGKWYDVKESAEDDHCYPKSSNGRRRRQRQRRLTACDASDDCAGCVKDGNGDDVQGATDCTFDVGQNECTRTDGATLLDSPSMVAHCDPNEPNDQNNNENNDPNNGPGDMDNMYILNGTGVLIYILKLMVVMVLLIKNIWIKLNGIISDKHHQKKLVQLLIFIVLIIVLIQRNLINHLRARPMHNLRKMNVLKKLCAEFIIMKLVLNHMIPQYLANNMMMLTIIRNAILLYKMHVMLRVDG